MGFTIRILEEDFFLKDLKAWQHEATEGEGRLAFVGGEAGMGKTVLVRILAQTVEGVARVAVGACDPRSTPRPLGPRLEVAEAVAPGTARLLVAGPPPGGAAHGIPRGNSPVAPPAVLRGMQWGRGRHDPYVSF